MQGLDGWLLERRRPPRQLLLTAHAMHCCVPEAPAGRRLSPPSTRPHTFCTLLRPRSHPNLHPPEAPSPAHLVHRLLHLGVYQVGVGHIEAHRHVPGVQQVPKMCD